MKYIKLYESFLPRDLQIKNTCWYNAKIGDILEESYIYQYVEILHRNGEDFTEGDIAERLQQFSKYKLMEINISDINIDEYELVDIYVNKYKEMYNELKTYPPIVLDSDRSYSYANKYTIIDGNHRVNALNDLGFKSILSWVGI